MWQKLMAARMPMAVPPAAAALRGRVAVSLNEWLLSARAQPLRARLQSAASAHQSPSL